MPKPQEALIAPTVRPSCKPDPYLDPKRVIGPVWKALGQYFTHFAGVVAAEAAKCQCLLESYRNRRVVDVRDAPADPHLLYVGGGGVLNEGANT